MTLLGWLILLIVAAIVGACGEMIGGVKVPGGPCDLALTASCRLASAELPVPLIW